MLYAMVVMVLWTLMVGIFAVKIRLTSVRQGRVSAKYFKLMQGDDVPEMVIRTTRCFNNLFEIPVLFYLVCALYLSLEITSVAALCAAWVFVALRIAHTYIHLTYNNVVHRMYVYGLGILPIVVLWVVLLYRYQS